ncbi:PilZ domain-containing protein [Pedomonas mirosovicensis]|uniref:PilZ domain-containing protein n=1 Tax=Pedomonas mirosovicensis TaxID=2908641 RepID=UPI002167AF4B|nr:PilZ domain-containing protein [Pedomonas mirosovicensis]MCH8684890.1 PilZ domain-containing protein [Pedomonas mirosovicensis]
MRQVFDGQATNRRTAPRYWVRSSCILHTPDGPLNSRLRDISAAGAFLEMRRGPNPGTLVRLEHPTAGSLEGTVIRRTEDGISLAFAPSDGNVSFALQVISAEIAGAQASDGKAGAQCSPD